MTFFCEEMEFSKLIYGMLLNYVFQQNFRSAARMRVEL